MGTTLTGTTPQDTYDSLIKVTDNGPIGATAKFLSDGLGNDSVLALSTSRVTIGGTNPYVGLLTIYGSASLSAGFGLRNSAGTAAGSFSTYAAGSGGGSTDISIGSAGFLEMNTAGVERMRITSTGNVGIGTDAPDTLVTLGSAARTDNTAGIKIFRGGGTASFVTYGFSGNAVINSVGGDLVIQRESSERARFTTAGLCFNGDFAAANALDDYEEGTFTPTFAGSTTNPTVTYAVQSGFYTKIGRQVTVTFEVGTTANTGGVGSLQMAGLPFTVGSRVYNCVATYNINNSTATAMSIFAQVNAGGTKSDFLATGDNTTWAAVNWTDATNASIYVNGSFTYFV